MKINFGNTISCTSGLIINILLFYGIGPVFYLYDESLNENLDKAVVLNQMELLYPYLITGLFFSFSIFHAKNKYSHLKNFSTKSLKINWVLLILSYTSQTLSQLSVAKSGIGTILPVLTYLLYPCIVQSIVLFQKANFESILFFCVTFLLTIYVGIVAQWRSILILIIFCLILGLYLRNKKSLKYTFLFGIIFVLIVMPYQQSKKAFEGDLESNQAELISNALTLENNDRFLILSEFISVRINYARETGYILNGIKENMIFYYNGETYLNIFKQLVPRFFWNNKPTFSWEHGFEIPRKVGLLSRSDDSTSWGVNYIAEFSYNFALCYLPIFIFLLFSLLKYIDSLAASFVKNNQLLFALNLSLFFMGLSLVSIVYFSTYFLWIFIVIKFISLFFYENTSLRRNRQNW